MVGVRLGHAPQSFEYQQLNESVSVYYRHNTINEFACEEGTTAIPLAGDSVGIDLLWSVIVFGNSFTDDIRVFGVC